MVPPVTTYPGRPRRTLARVDLPDPFGPISAWTSPWRTVRSMPFRISLPSTDPCSPSISRVAASTAVCVCACVSAVTVHLDQDVVTFHLHREHLDRHGRRERPGPARLQVERGTVLRALDGPEVHVHLPLVQVGVGVRADRVDGPESVVAQVDHGDLPVAHPVPPDLPHGNVTGGRYLHQRH